ncbi:TonB-dependent Receptor Plug Domain protein [compost metagenome]
MKKLLQSLFILVFVAGAAFAQERTVTGKVTGMDDGLPIPGVSVKVVGTANGTSTDANGNYALKVASGQTSIEFSSIGYLKQIIAIGSSNTLNAQLSTDSRELGEVVVVAYGTAKRAEVTGSIATLSSKDIEKRTVTNITSALAGIAPGVIASTGNGQPGTGPSIRLRGFGSFNASNSPLYVLDGSQFDGNLGDINPNDIESVSVLKDATSAALYGARASNGVVLITTKRGRSETPTISAGIIQGFSERGIPEYDRVGTLDYYPVVWQGMKNNFMFSATTKLTDAAAAAKASTDVQKQLIYNPFNVPNTQIVGTDGKLNPNASLLYDDFDWYKPMERTGKRTDATLSTSGKTDKSDYYVSLGYLKDQGYIIKSDFKRFNGRINANSQVKPWLKMGLNLSASFSDANIASDNSTNSNSSIINAFAFARSIGPIYPVRAFDATGSPIYNELTKEQWYDYGIQPGALNRPQGAFPGRNLVYETMLNDNLYRRNLIGGRSYVDVKFLKDFTFTPSINIDIRNNNSNEFRNRLVGDGAGQNGLGFNRNTTIKSFTFNQILRYEKTVKEHNFAALVGHENYDFTYRTFSATKTGVILDGNTEFVNFVTPNDAGGYRSNETIESYFSRFNYNFSGKYFAEASIRRDGSGRFSPESRWGTFYSLGASWAITKESFMENQTWVDDLRLKASYGAVGNNNVLNIDGDSEYYPDRAFYSLGWNNGTEAGLLWSSKAAPNLKWESSNSLNLGLSFSVLNKRIYGELEYYKKGSSNLIFSLPQPKSDGIDVEQSNIGSMYNSGFELQLGADIVRTKDFTWNLLTNWATVKNRITKLPAETPIITVGTKRREVGGDYYRFWLRQYAGVDPSDGSALYIPADGTAPANIRSVNGVNYVTNQSFAKFDYSGTAIPDLYGSFTNTLRYKDLSLSFLVVYQLGGKFFDSVYQGLMSNGSFGSALHTDVLNSWTPQNPTSNIPRLDPASSANTNATSNRFLISASYISFKNVNLSYNLPKSILGKLDVSNARVFVTGENLGLISKRKGMDPTEAFTGLNANTYVPSRMISFGINFSL